MENKQLKATATFNEDGTKVTITVEGKEGKTFTTKISALNHGDELLNSKAVDEDSLWKAREIILDANNLETGTEEEINEAREKFLKEFIGIELGLAAILGQRGISFIGISVGRSKPEKGDQKNKKPVPMEKPIFEMCSCGTHGKIIDEAGKSDGHSNDLGSQEHAKSWVKFGIEKGILKSEQEAGLLAQIEASGLFKTDKERSEKMAMA